MPTEEAFQITCGAMNKSVIFVNLFVKRFTLCVLFQTASDRALQAMTSPPTQPLTFFQKASTQFKLTNKGISFKYLFV